MNFIKVPRSNRGSKRKTKSVRCYFKKDKNKYNSLIIRISIDVIEELGFSTEKKVDFFICEDNPKIWLIRQDKNSQSYTLNTKIKKSYSAIMSLKWDYFEFPDNSSKTRELKYDFYDGGLRIYYED